jgi:TonB-linked SusC/RagA family outer membrane protein
MIKTIVHQYCLAFLCLFSFFFVSNAQAQKVQGTITDAKGEILVGVAVQVKGTNNWMVTDLDGKYSLNVPGGNGTLIFTLIGYKTAEIATNGRLIVNVVMEEEVTSLDEVLVTGYSTERKKDIIGSVSVVQVDKMKQINSATVSNQLQGLASGVIVTGDGTMDGAKVRIRGFGSFGDSEPLYIIDGMPAGSAVFNSLNSNDVESIQVLKDAASASIYGARAANGVVIITTVKGGKNIKPQVTFDMYSGINYVNSNEFPALLNAEEYGRYWYLAQTNAGNEPTHAQYTYDAQGNVIIPEYIKAGSYSGANLISVKQTNPSLYSSLIDPANYNFQTHQIVKSGDTDWFNELYNPASVTNIQLGMSNRTDAGSYAVSFNYYNSGNPGNEYAYFHRYTVRANSSFNITKHLQVGENLQVVYNDRSGSGYSSSAWYMQPLIPVYDIMGNPTGGACVGLSQARNPIATNWRNRLDRTYTGGMFGNVFADLKISDFVFHTSFGLDYRNVDDWDITQKTYEDAENTETNSLARTMTMYRNWTWTNTLTYAKAFGQHNVKILLGTEAIDNYNDNVYGYRDTFDFDDNEDFMVLDAGLGTQSATGTYARTSLFSIFGRADYSFADKYLFNATLRRDGSSKFGENYRYGLFPSVGIGWRISQEPFMKDIRWINDLKLRASWGIIGNQNGLSASNQYTQYIKNNQQGGYAISGGNTSVNGYYVSTIGNPDARWEKNETTNIGFDASLFDGKLDVSAEYFKKVTKDLLVQNQAPQTGSNATQPSVNVGQMTNRGFDFNITNRGQIFGAINYTAVFNFTHYRNIVDRVLDSDASYIVGYNSLSMSSLVRTEKGKPMSYIYTYQVDGFFTSQKEVDDYLAAGYSSPITPKVGRWRLKDLNGDKIINEGDRSMTGSPHPDFQLGTNLTLQWKDFDFGFFVFWNQGGKIFNLSRLDVDFNRFTYNRSKRMLYQSYSIANGADNSNALLPVIDASDSETTNIPTDYYVEDATYLRLKNLSLGYTIPKKLTDKINLGRVRVYIQGQNLITIKGGKKPFSGMDPEAALSGSDIGMGVIGSQSPTPSNFVGGININF